MVSISERFDQQSQAAIAQKPYLVVDGTAVSYGDIGDKFRRMFAFFRAKNLVPGDRIAIFSTSVVDVATVMLGAIRYGIATVNLNPEMSASDLAIAVRACKLSRVFIDKAIYDRIGLPEGCQYSLIEPPKIEERKSLFGLLKSKTITAQGFGAELDALTPADPPAHASADSTAMMLFTSGTTSAPKVVELSHANLSSQLDAFFDVFDYDQNSRILNPLPLHFTDGMLHGPIVTYMSGATLLRPSKFDFQKFEDLLHGIYRDRITHFVVVPAILSMLDRLGDSFLDAFQTKDFRYIRCSGDLLPETLWRNVQERFRVKVVNTYGMSETVCEALFAGPSDETLKVGTVGKPTGCEIKIVDEQGVKVPDGETGELLIRGGMIMKGYLDQPELTASTFLDGWLKTGDLATVDKEGFVRIQGRRKQLIISGGVNVHPQDITDCLLAHPSVAEAVTFGLPHPIWGEQIAAAVILRDGKMASAQDLIAHCAKILSPHKVPRMISVMKDLPRNSSGKVLLKDLKEKVLGQDAPEGSSTALAVDEQVIHLAAKTFSIDAKDLRLTAAPGTVKGWDSFSHLNLIAAIEKKFDISLSSSDILRIRNLGDLIVLTKNNLQK
jgi:long-chain acyl-CoA synthetase